MASSPCAVSMESRAIVIEPLAVVVKLSRERRQTTPSKAALRERVPAWRTSAAPASIRISSGACAAAPFMVAISKQTVAQPLMSLALRPPRVRKRGRGRSGWKELHHPAGAQIECSFRRPAGGNVSLDRLRERIQLHVGGPARHQVGDRTGGAIGRQSLGDELGEHAEG